MSDTFKQVDTYLEEHLDDYIAETANLCAQPSISAKGEGMQECATLVSGMLERRGFTVERYETLGNPIIMGFLAGASERTLMCYNHYDVQPVEPLELWTNPPFEPTVRDGALYARGAKDDKGEFVARLAALDAVRAAHGGTMPCSVLFVVEGEEEIGSPHMVAFVEANREKLRCDGAIWEEGGTNNEGQPVQWLGCRGVLAVELSVETMSKDAHSGNAHVLPNAAWRLTRALNTLKDVDERVRIPGFYDDVQPPSGLDQIHFAALPNEEDFIRESFGVKEFLRGVTGTAFWEAVFEPTCNIQGLESGYTGKGMKTVIPARATAKLDFRLVPHQDPEDILAKLRQHLDAEGFSDVAVTRLGAMWPYKADADDPLIQLTTRTAEEVYGSSSLIYPLVGGSSPVYAVNKPLGIPVVSAGVGYGLNNRTHAPDEHVRLSDFLKAAQHIARIMEGFAELE